MPEQAIPSARGAYVSGSNDWFSFFCNWPAALPRAGVLVTSLNETMPFRDFWIKDEMLLIERTTPDAMGARFVLLTFGVINVVKFTNPLSAADISGAGFQADVASRQPVAV